MKQTLCPIFWLWLLSASSIAYGHPTLFQSQGISVQHSVSLTVESTGWSAELFWTTKFDKDLVAFAVERSADGVDYQDIINYDRYHVPAHQFDSYREQDNDPLPGDNFYRIRFTLADGEVVHSERRKLFFKEVPPFEIFPNPTGRQVNLMMRKFRGQPVDVLVHDGTGTLVFQQHVPQVGDGFLRIELASMEPGIYSVSVVHKGRTFTRRLVVTAVSG